MAQEYPGSCQLCGDEMARRKMSGHVAVCGPKHDKGSRSDALVQLHVEAEEAPEYWLFVEGREDASLQQLDSLLRRVWLECCGHMSAFRVGRIELSKRSALGSLSPKGPAFQYDYDFGSTTTLSAKVLGLREGSLGRHVLRVLARNAPPKLECADCGAPATLICPFCLDSGRCLFCRVHARKHPCASEHAFMPTVNSPRMGVCGYTG